MDRRALGLVAFGLALAAGMLLFGQQGVYPPSGGTGGGGTWGSIIGTLSAQTDLSTALAGKAAVASLRRVTAATDTATTSDGAIVCSAASNSVVETLPPTPTAGESIEFKRVDSTGGNSCTLTANAGQNIEGGATAGSLNVPTGTAYRLRWESATSTWWIF
jgi:hypothetical protein